MRYTRGLIMGFVVGSLIGLFIYLRLQQGKRTMQLQEEDLRLVVDIGQEKIGETGKAAPPPVEQDPLEEIRGIGPVYQQRLREAGVRSFAELAAQTPERLREIIGARVALDDYTAWIEEAKRLAQT